MLNESINTMNPEPTGLVQLPTAPNAPFYSPVQYSALKQDMTKYIVMAGVGGLVVGYVLARVMK